MANLTRYNYNRTRHPHQRAERIHSYGTLNGGVNLRDAEFRLRPGESPECENVWWEDGILRSRPGQAWASASMTGLDGGTAAGFACTETPFHGSIFCHIGNMLCMWDTTAEADGDILPAPSLLCAGIPENAGTFFRYDEYLFYKNRGAYVKIAWNAATGQFNASNAEDDAFVPTILINADPATGAGDLYQPENRLSPKKRVVYTISQETATVTRLANGNGIIFDLGEGGEVTAADIAAIIQGGTGTGGNTEIGGTGTGGTETGGTGTGGTESGGTGTGGTETGGTESGNGTETSGGTESGGGTGSAGEEDIEAMLNRMMQRSLTTEELGRLHGIRSIYVDGAYVEPALYTLDRYAGAVCFESAPDRFAVVVITVELNPAVYHLPVPDLDSVDSVYVDGVEIPASGNWTADLTAGTVTFASGSAPEATDPPTQNTVEIVYSKANANALNDIMDCRYAAVCGTGTDLCVVFAGNPDAPNGVFWTGHGALWREDSSASPSTSAAAPVLHYGYWPMTNYNLVGDSQDGITGFGTQYADLLVFQSGAVGKLTPSTESVDGRNTIALSWTRVNAHIGCGCPDSIRTVENNVVFCDREGGVYQVQSASPAYENNIRCISGKINGSRSRPGLLLDLEVTGGEGVTALDDGQRYWLCVNGHVWVWDYELSTADDPVWFFFSGFPGTGGSPPAAWFHVQQNVWHLNTQGRFTKLGRTFSDYGAAIHKVYQFPVAWFDSFDRLKDILTLQVSVPSDTPSDTAVIYQTDYENRQDRVNLTNAGYNRVESWDLTVRDLSVPRYGHVFRRRPMCRHVRHFSLRFENNTAGCDLAVQTVEITYRFLGRDR